MRLACCVIVARARAARHAHAATTPRSRATARSSIASTSSRRRSTGYRPARLSVGARRSRASCSISPIRRASSSIVGASEKKVPYALGTYDATGARHRDRRSRPGDARLTADALPHDLRVARSRCCSRALAETHAGRGAHVRRHDRHRQARADQDRARQAHARDRRLRRRSGAARHARSRAAAAQARRRPSPRAARSAR